MFYNLFKEKDKKIQVKLNLNRFGILIVDMQYSFLKEIHPKKSKELIERQRELIEICGEKNYPVIVVEYSNHGKTHKDLKEIIENLKYKCFLEKEKDDSFKNTSLKGVLKYYNIDDLLITGISSLFCVKDTVQSARRFFNNVITSKDLMEVQAYFVNRVDVELKWYRENTIYFEDYKKIISLIR
ncbi:MAG: cysteine hydrolase family protein [Candidatus Woesearchaeota archaeon]